MIIRQTGETNEELSDEQDEEDEVYVVIHEKFSDEIINEKFSDEVDEEITEKVVSCRDCLVNTLKAFFLWTLYMY